MVAMETFPFFQPARYTRSFIKYKKSPPVNDKYSNIFLKIFSKVQVQNASTQRKNKNFKRCALCMSK